MDKLALEERFLLALNKIPKKFFVTSGKGESDVGIHTGSFHLALKDAGIDGCNIVPYSSMLPAICEEVSRPEKLVHGSVLEVVMARADSTRGKRATAGLIFGWLYEEDKRKGGIVCEYSGNLDPTKASARLQQSLQEVYSSSFPQYKLKNVRCMVESFVPRKKFGTALVAICFVEHLIPLLSS